MSTPFYQKARRQLSRKCSTAKRPIGSVGPCTPTPNPADPFTLLVRCVISQQISTKAAASIRQTRGAGRGPPVPIAKLAKFERRQLQVLRHLWSQAANACLHRPCEVQTQIYSRGIEERDDATIHQQATAIKGIGPEC
ncbi:MAG: hypothetical protein U0792_07885 [Gemmataceae bacterium]